MALFQYRLAAATLIVYLSPMPIFLRQIIQNVVTKIASDPVLREKATNVAQDIVEESKQILREEDRAYAAGKAFRRALTNLQKK